MTGPGEYLFGLGRGHVPARAARIAARHGAQLVNYTEPRGEKRHWFAGPNRGEPFDRELAAAVLDELAAEGLIE